jgi:hypothetical protein
MHFGAAVVVSGNNGLVGAHTPADPFQLTAYYFPNVNVATGTTTEAVQLTISETVGGTDWYPFLSFSENNGLIGVNFGNEYKGAAYFYRSLDSASGIVTETAKLTASDATIGDQFGNATSLSGKSALIGAWTKNDARGAAYLFRNLDTATGSITETAKLTASDGANSDNFGVSVSVQGNIGLVGAILKNDAQGGAYLFRNLDTATGTITETAKLAASDGVVGDRLGYAVSISGNSGLVSASAASGGRGAVYFYQHLESATGLTTETAKLVASDQSVSGGLGASVSLSADTALIGDHQGNAYLFLNLDNASGTLSETIKITATNDAGSGAFGRSVSLDGDLFIIGKSSGNSTVADSGVAYTGSVSSLTTLNDGNTIRNIEGISFISQTDWIIGQTTDGNQVTLTQGDSADISTIGRSVYVGQTAGSDHNTLLIEGNLATNEVHIGSILGNEGNVLQLEDTASFAASAFYLAPANFLAIEGDYSDITVLLTYLETTDLLIWDGTLWQEITESNADSLISHSFSGGYTTIAAIPEPGTYGLLGLGLAACFGYYSSRKKRQT